ncbi:hypothetical protein AGLY_000220 [Aphis glycines]|uniref:Uncharacterized protein n=1 Tax=Aphis glycines TaxID=307491 RepID=A0A6G0U6C8_APHGL|nr:hypothetical protein AGLY_000220 [Aphis glycines]
MTIRTKVDVMEVALYACIKYGYAKLIFAENILKFRFLCSRERMSCSVGKPDRMERERLSNLQLDKLVLAKLTLIIPIREVTSYLLDPIYPLTDSRDKLEQYNTCFKIKNIYVTNLNLVDGQGVYISNFYEICQNRENSQNKKFNSKFFISFPSSSYKENSKHHYYRKNFIRVEIYMSKYSNYCYAVKTPSQKII